MNLQNIKIGTLIGIGIILIIFVMMSATLYSNYLSGHAQNIIDVSTSRIVGAIEIQRNTEELIFAHDNLVVLATQDKLDAAQEKIRELFKGIESTISKDNSIGILQENELVKLRESLKNISDVSARIFELRRDLISQGLDYGGLYISESKFATQALELNNEFDKLRRLKYEIYGVAGEVLKRSGDDFRGALELMHRARMITWVIVGISLVFVLILAYFIVRFAKKIYELKNEFINIIAHDLRNPVTAIIGFVDMIKTDEDGSKKDLEEYINIIHASALKLRNQINNLLEVGRSEAGVLKIELEPVDLSEVLDESVKRAKAIAMALKMRIDYSKNTNLPKVTADKNKIIDVIDNLISNALKYNRENGTVIISSSISDKKVIVSVRDTGFGIPEAEKGKIFKKYSRLGGKSQKKTGTGLGLYTAKMLVERMGGSISFTSQEGKGTTFSVSLNIAEVK